MRRSFLKNVFLICLVSFALGFQRKFTLCGRWISYYNVFDYLSERQKGVVFFEFGHKLHLYRDSTFIDSSCGNVLYGHWVHKGNSVLLYSNRTVYRKAWYYKQRTGDWSYDSINGKLRNDTLKYFIENDELVKHYHAKSSLEDPKEQAHKGVTILKRSDDTKAYQLRNLKRFARLRKYL